MKRNLVLVVVAVALMLMACQRLEKTARDAIAAEKGFLDKAEENHGLECLANPLPGTLTWKLCAAIKKAGLARNVAIDALELYCSGMPPAGQAGFLQGGPCRPDKSVAPKLEDALNDLKRDISDIRALLGDKK